MICCRVFCFFSGHCYTYGWCVLMNVDNLYIKSYRNHWNLSMVFRGLGVQVRLVIDFFKFPILLHYGKRHSRNTKLGIIDNYLNRREI